jgi:hypothetical protein
MKFFSLTQHRLISTLATATTVSLGLVQPALAQSASISGVSQEVFSCMRKHTREVTGWIVYEGNSSGRIKVYAPAIGQVGEVTYSLNANQSALDLTYVRGPAPLGQIQGGLTNTANKCRSGEFK